jgi:iron complex transport system permease protein
MRTAILSMACIALVFVSPFLGSLGPEEAQDFIFWQLRIPRTIVGALVGLNLGLTGAAFQCLFGNPLATPSTTGTTAGAALGALFALVLLPPALSFGGYALIICAFLGALMVAGPVAVFAARQQARLEDVLLAGIALTLAAGALTTGLQFQADLAATHRAVQWSLGSLSQVGYEGIKPLLPVTILCSAALLRQTKGLESLIAGEERAFSQGVDITKLRIWVLGAGSLGVATCVAMCGPIAFVGLVVPHIVRLGLGSARRRLLPMSAISGAAFLVVSDTIARNILPVQELPVGVITAAIGAPLLIWLILRRRT